MAGFLTSVEADSPALGCFSFLPSPQLVEVLGLAGFDFVIVDREHSPNDWLVVESLLRAAEARGIAALVRVTGNDSGEILRALDCGADGVVVPGIRTPEDAAAAAAAMRFAPGGIRGACPASRAAGYGHPDYPSFQKEEDESRVLALLIEEPEALAQIAEIAAAAVEVGGPVACMIGRSDLAASLGHFGEPTAPEVVEATVEAIGRVAAAHPEVILGMGVYSPSEPPFWRDCGCRFFWHGADASIVLDATRTLVGRMRSELSGV